MKTEKEFTALICNKRTNEIYSECGSYISKKAFKEDLTFDGFNKILVIYNGNFSYQEIYEKYQNEHKMKY